MDAIDRELPEWVWDARRKIAEEKRGEKIWFISSVIGLIAFYAIAYLLSKP